MTKKKLPYGVRKHIRLQKAKIRREFFDIKKREEMINKVYEKFMPKKPVVSDTSKDAKKKIAKKQGKISKKTTAKDIKKKVAKKTTKVSKKIASKGTKKKVAKKAIKVSKKTASKDAKKKTVKKATKK